MGVVSNPARLEGWDRLFGDMTVVRTDSTNRYTIRDRGAMENGPPKLSINWESGDRDVMEDPSESTAPDRQVHWTTRE